MSKFFGRASVSFTALTLLIVAGCTSTTPPTDAAGGSAKGSSALVIQPPPSASIAPTAGSRSSAGISVTPSLTPTPASPSVADPASPPSAPVSTSSGEALPQEEADRAAIEAQWMRYWRLYIDIVEMPEAVRPSAADAVAVDPTYSNLLKYADYFNDNGRQNYGTVKHRLSWMEPISGASQAVLSDCQDQSHFGASDAKSGKKLSVGVVRDNIKANFIKGQDGVWRISDIYYLLDIEC